MGNISQPDISQEEIAALAMSELGMKTVDVCTSEWIGKLYGAHVRTGSQRGKILETFLNAPKRILTFNDLILLAAQYSARVYELRRAGFDIQCRGEVPNTHFELMVSPQDETAIRAALRIVDKVPRKRPARETQTFKPTIPPADARGQFLLGVG